MEDGQSPAGPAAGRAVAAVCPHIANRRARRHFRQDGALRHVDVEAELSSVRVSGHAAVRQEDVRRQ